MKTDIRPPFLSTHTADNAHIWYYGGMKHGVHHSPLALPRSFAPDVVRVKGADGVIAEYSAKEFTKYYNVETLIRILNDEYQFINHDLPLLTHFNMEFGGHKVGSKVLLPRILRQGYFKNQEDEMLPILSMKNIYIGTVVKKREHVPYSTLLSSKLHLKYSIEFNHGDTDTSLEYLLIRKKRHTDAIAAQDCLLELLFVLDMFH